MRSSRSASMRDSGRRIGIAVLGAAAVLGFVASPAQASSYTSYLSNAGPGFESSRWNDNGGTTVIKFTGCRDNYTDTGMHILLRKDVLGVDPAYVNGYFTNCFTSTTATSTGTWVDHGSGSYYFVVNSSLVGVNVWVNSLTISY